MPEEATDYGLDHPTLAEFAAALRGSHRSSSGVNNYTKLGMGPRRVSLQKDTWSNNYGLRVYGQHGKLINVCTVTLLYRPAQPLTDIYPPEHLIWTPIKSSCLTCGCTCTYGSCRREGCHCVDCGCKCGDATCTKCSHCTVCLHNDPGDCERRLCTCLQCKCEYGESFAELEQGPMPTHIPTFSNMRAIVLRDTQPEPIGPPHSDLLGHPDIPSRLAGWYLLMDYNLDEPMLVPTYNKITAELSEHFSNYLLMACVGEARHCSGLAPSTLDMLDTTPRVLSKMLSCHVHNMAIHNHRHVVWALGYELACVFGRETVLSWCDEIFSKLPWSGAGAGGIGGKRWAKIAQLGLEYERKQISSTMFIDRVVDIVHNGGWALNKYYRKVHECLHHAVSIQTVLNIKANDARQLPQKICIPKAVGGALDIAVGKHWREPVQMKEQDHEQKQVFKLGGQGNPIILQNTAYVTAYYTDTTNISTAG